MNKNIVGLIGNAETCNKAAEILQGFGFYKLEISPKVKEVAKYLLKLNDEEINTEVIDQIRDRGYHVNQFYWINLTLANLPENKVRIVVPDLRVEDVIETVIAPYYLGKVESCPPNIRCVDSINLKENLEKLFKPASLAS